MITVTTAKFLAEILHRGQQDKGGRPYIEHVARVASKFEDRPEIEACAWLHDAIEDTQLKLTDLDGLNVSKKQRRILMLLTRTTDYHTYIIKMCISCPPEGLEIKLADLEDNLDFKRLNKTTSSKVDKERIQKYKLAHTIISKELSRYT